MTADPDLVRDYGALLDEFASRYHFSSAEDLSGFALGVIQKIAGEDHRPAAFQFELILAVIAAAQAFDPTRPLLAEVAR